MDDTGDLLEAHARRLTRHSIRTAFTHLAYSAVVGPQLGWGPRPAAPPVLLDPFEAVASFREDAEYTDFHAWHFLPFRFELAIPELGLLGLSDRDVEKLEGPEGFEFFGLLRRGPETALSTDVLQERRRHLLVQQLAEVREQVDFMLGEYR